MRPQLVIILPKWFHTVTAGRIPRKWKAGVIPLYLLPVYKPCRTMLLKSIKFYQKNLPWLVVALMVMAMLTYLLKYSMPGADRPNPVLRRWQILHSKFTSLGDMASTEPLFLQIDLQK